SSNQHQMRCLTLPREIRDQVQRRIVTPMKVFKNQHQRELGGQRLQRVAHLAKHALPSCAVDLATQQLSIRSVDQKRHRQKPHRLAGAKPIDDLAMLSAQLPDGFENRQIGFAGTVLFQALTATYAYGSIGSNAASESINQDSLADACFSGDENDLTFSIEH